VRVADADYESGIRGHDLHGQAYIQSLAHGVVLSKATLKFLDDRPFVPGRERNGHDLALYAHVSILRRFTFANHHGGHERDRDPDREPHAASH
jgi:hypothetical protein